MIGKQPDLLAAAFGKKPRDTTKPPQRMVPVSQGADPSLNLQSRARREALMTSGPQLFQGAAREQIAGRPGAMTQAYSQFQQETPTKMFADILATGGYSGRGKYGGFSTASDQEAAVLGATYQLLDEYVPRLRQQEQKVSEMATEARREASKNLFKGVTGKIPALPMGMKEVPEGSVYATRVNPYREYAKQLQDWEQQLKPMTEEYLQTARQIESTPMAELATQIAIQRYGMDPALARGRFANIGTEYSKKKRDEEYMRTTGMPYEEYKFEQERLAELDEAEIEAQKSELETLTGLRSTTLSEATAQTPEQLYRILSDTKMSYQIPDPATGELAEYNGAGVIQALRDAISDPNSAASPQDIFDAVEAIPGSEGMRLLISALLNEYLATPEKTRESLENYGFFR